MISLGSASTEPTTRAQNTGQYLVLQDSLGIDRAVAKVGQHADQFGNFDTQLLARPARHRAIHRLVGCGMSAERIGPDAGKGALVQCPSGQQHVPRVVEEIAGECQMQWSRVVMYLRFRRRADASTRIVEKDNELLALNGIHRHHRDIACTDRGRLLLLCVDSLPTRRRIGPVGDIRGGARWP